MPVLANGLILRGASSLQADLTSIQWAASVDLQDATDLADSARVFIPGLIGSELAIEGFYNGGTGAIDSLFSGDLGASATTPLSVLPGGGSVGSRTYVMAGRLQTYDVRAPSPGEIVGFSATWTSEERIGHGIVLADLVARTVSGNGTSQDNGSATSNGGIANLHVTAGSGTSPTLTAKVQHSADGSTWADLITFTAATGTTSESKTVTGTVNRYVRATWTIGGTSPSFTFAITFAR
jgi:hypothetical protein